MTKILDYLGNEVKPGMEIYFVSTNIHYMAGFIKMPQSMGGKLYSHPATDTPCWILGKEYLVYENNDELYTDYKANGFTFSQPIKDKFIFTDNIIIAIKGLSDNEPTKNILVN